MQLLDLSTRSLEQINFAPKTLREEVEQNLCTIIATSINTVPLFRKFAFDKSMLDKPVQVIQARFSSEFLSKAKKFEPRAIISKIDYSSSDWQNGKIQPKIYYKLKEK